MSDESDTIIESLNEEGDRTRAEYTQNSFSIYMSTISFSVLMSLVKARDPDFNPKPLIKFMMEAWRISIKNKVIKQLDGAHKEGDSDILSKLLGIEMGDEKEKWIKEIDATGDRWEKSLIEASDGDAIDEFIKFAKEYNN